MALDLFQVLLRSYDRGHHMSKMNWARVKRENLMARPDATPRQRPPKAEQKRRPIELLVERVAGVLAVKQRPLCRRCGDRMHLKVDSFGVVYWGHGPTT